jgi:Sugar-transfer associated ATP-grasp
MVDFRKIPRELINLLVAFRNNSARARRDAGVAPVRQVLDMVRLRVGPGKLRSEDYYRMRVYRRNLSFDQKREFVSQPAVGLPRRWDAVANDKLLCYALLEYEGVRIPEIHAICHPLRSFGKRLVLRSVSQISEYLRSAGRYPFISKPVDGMFSRGVVLVEQLESDSGLLRVGEGSPMPVQQFAEDCLSRRDGTMFQEVLRPHPDIAAQISQRLCTLRLIVLLERDDVRLFRAYWKIAAAGNIADNYWHPGNLIARLDGTGRIEQCMTGLGPDFRIVERHPVSGQLLKGFQVPFYREAVELTQQTARAFIGMKMQAWDISVTSEGPVPLEVNDIGSVFLPQTADQHGMYDREFREYVARTRNQT